MKHRTRHISSLWQAASLLMIGPILPVFCQEIDSHQRIAALQHTPPKVTRYVNEILRRHDNSGDGRLQQAEWLRMQGAPQKIDRNHDGIITATELQAYVMAYARARMPVSSDPADEQAGLPADSLSSPTILPEGDAASAQSGSVAAEDAGPNDAGSRRTTKFVVRPSRATHNLPAWFVSRDTDGDRQLTLREFGADAGGRSREFKRLDQNGDGMLTPQEATAPPPAEPTSSRETSNPI